MKSVHIVIPDLFLPQLLAVEICADLKLPALEKLLARAQHEPLPAATLETWLCEAFGVAGQGVAPVTLRADGMDAGASYWLCATPVHLDLQRDQMILQTDVRLTADEAAQLCASLNTHFYGAGMHFLAPQPQRWYLRLDAAPDMTTQPLAQVAGKNAHAYLPQGEDALYWHGVLNEIQMLMFGHEINQAHEAQGKLPVNSLWLWGGARAAGELARPFDRVCGDSELAAAFARVAGIPGEPLPDDTTQCGGGDVLIVWEGLRRAIQRGDLHAWRDELQRFERCCAAPLLAALSAGHIETLTLDVLPGGASSRFVLTRGSMWKLWRRPKRLAHYALV